MYESPGRDGGYDIADFYNVHPDYGTMDDVRAFIEAAHERGIRVIADLVMNHTSSDRAWFQEARSSPDNPKRDWYVWTDDPTLLLRGADHLRRHRDVELDLGRHGRRLLLASLLSSPARPELRQPRGAGGDARRPALLAGRRAGRLSPRRRALPLRARGHELREPRRDARVPQGGARGRRRRVPRPRPARRGQPVAGRRRGLLRRRRRVPHGVPLPGHAAHVHGAAPRGGDADPRDPLPDAAHPGQLPVGPVPAQPRRADARDGHRRGTRLHVRRVRQGPAHEAQRRHPPAPRAAHGRRPRRDRAAARDAVQPAGLAGPVLRRRDRDGRQRLPRRPRRRAHADAVDRRPQRRLLAARTSRSSTRRR